MSYLLAAVLGAAAVLLFRPVHQVVARFRRAAEAAPSAPGGRKFHHRLAGSATAGTWKMPGRASGVPLTLVVQQLAALLKGGRSPGRLWEELWVLYGGPDQQKDLRPAGYGPGMRMAPAAGSAGVAGTGRGAGLAEGSVTVLASARAAAGNGAPVSEAIRASVVANFPRSGREARIWSQLAACFDIAEASGCPLADVLTRFAAQLEVEDDADAARQTALAGPKATVRLLTWLPVIGLVLGMALGVDPVSILLGTHWGLAALAAGIALTVTGRLWSAKLVAAAAGSGAL